MRIIVFTILCFIALLAIGSGLIMMIDTSGRLLDLSTDILINTPFTNFLLPGIALVLLIGCSAALALFFWLGRQDERAYNWSLISGVSLLIWLILQMTFVQWANWLNYLCLGGSILIILGALQLKNKSLT
jgi:hypothetical protein